MAWYLLWHSQTTWELYLASVLLPAHAPQNIHTKWPSSCWPLSSQCTTLSWTDGEKGSESVLRSWHRAMVIRKTNNTLAGGFVFVVDWYGCIYIFIYYFLKIFEAVTYSHNLTTHTYVYIYIDKHLSRNFFWASNMISQFNNHVVLQCGTYMTGAGPLRWSAGYPPSFPGTAKGQGQQLSFNGPGGQNSTVEN
jgi:hypothetical protein